MNDNLDLQNEVERAGLQIRSLQRANAALRRENTALKRDQARAELALPQPDQYRFIVEAVSDEFRTLGMPLPEVGEAEVRQAIRDLAANGRLDAQYVVEAIADIDDDDVLVTLDTPVRDAVDDLVRAYNERMERADNAADETTKSDAQFRAISDHLVRAEDALPNLAANVVGGVGILVDAYLAAVAEAREATERKECSVDEHTSAHKAEQVRSALGTALGVGWREALSTTELVQRAHAMRLEHEKLCMNLESVHDQAKRLQQQAGVEPMVDPFHAVQNVMVCGEQRRLDHAEAMSAIRTALKMMGVVPNADDNHALQQLNLAAKKATDLIAAADARNVGLRGALDALRRVAGFDNPQSGEFSQLADEEAMEHVTKEVAGYDTSFCENMTQRLHWLATSKGRVADERDQLVKEHDAIRKLLDPDNVEPATRLTTLLKASMSWVSLRDAQATANTVTLDKVKTTLRDGPTRRGFVYVAGERVERTAERLVAEFNALYSRVPSTKDAVTLATLKASLLHLMRAVNGVVPDDAGHVALQGAVNKLVRELYKDEQVRENGLAAYTAHLGEELQGYVDQNDKLLRHLRLALKALKGVAHTTKDEQKTPAETMREVEEVFNKIAGNNWEADGVVRAAERADAHACVPGSGDATDAHAWLAHGLGLFAMDLEASLRSELTALRSAAMNLLRLVDTPQYYCAVNPQPTDQVTLADRLQRTARRIAALGAQEREDVVDLLTERVAMRGSPA